MFNNLGVKIKGVAKILFILVCVLAGFICFLGIAEETMFMALVVPAIIIVLYLPIIWAIAGLGELIFNSEKQTELLMKNNELLTEALRGNIKSKNSNEGDCLPRL